MWARFVQTAAAAKYWLLDLEQILSYLKFVEQVKKRFISVKREEEKHIFSVIHAHFFFFKKKKGVCITLNVYYSYYVLSEKNHFSDL